MSQEENPKKKIKIMIEELLKENEELKLKVKMLEDDLEIYNNIKKANRFICSCGYVSVWYSDFCGKCHNCDDCCECSNESSDDDEKTTRAEEEKEKESIEIEE
jgi:hypothetical protein